MNGTGSKISHMIEKRTLEQDLLALAAQSDSSIDTSEIAETVNFSQPMRARYFPLASRDYDIRAIANWCIKKAESEGRRIGTLWLNKIVYFIHEAAIKDFGVLLSQARVEAWKHGPVFREIFFDEKVEKQAAPLKKFNKRDRRMEEASEDFSASDVSIFETVWAQIGHKSGTELRALSHLPGSPWDVIWKQSENGNLGLEIDVATIMGRKARGYGRTKQED